MMFFRDAMKGFAHSHKQTVVHQWRVCPRFQSITYNPCRHVSGGHTNSKDLEGILTGRRPNASIHPPRLLIYHGRGAARCQWQL